MNFEGFFKPNNLSEKLISLREIANDLGLEWRQDARIYSAGKIPTDSPYRIVPCATAAHCHEAAGYSDIVALIVPPDLAESVPDSFGLVISANPSETMYRIHDYLCQRDGHYWDDFDTIIDPTAVIGAGAIIAEKNVIIGPHTHIKPGTVIMERTLIGAHCRVGPHATIGGNAFEITTVDGHRTEVSQAGGVRIGDYVVIQSLSNVDRSAFATFTEIEDETCLDSLIHVAHDCKIGKRVKITACTEMSGRVTVEDDAYFGPNSTISNGLFIGKSAKVSIGSVVIRDVEENKTVSGNFAVDHKKWIGFIKKLVRDGV